MDNQLIEAARKIKLFITDVDGVLTDGRVYYGSSETEIKGFHTQDGLGLKLLQQAGIEVAIITSRNSPIVTRRMTELGIRHIFQGKKNKLEAYHALLGDTGCVDAECAYVGDDLPDLSILKRCGLPVCVANAVPALKTQCRLVTERAGGDGAIREVTDFILTAQGHLDALINEFAAT